MATWTNIPDSVLEPGKPARSVDALALRDNAIAIAQGAAGAPKVTENAMNANSIHGNRLRSGTVTVTQMADNTITGAKFNNASVQSWLGSLAAEAVGTYLTTKALPQASHAYNAIVSGSNLMRPGAPSQRLPGAWRVLAWGISDSNEGLVKRIS